MQPSSVVSMSIIALLWAISLQDAYAWGRDGHVYVNQVAAQNLPTDVPGFLKAAAAELAYLGPEPDSWRDDSDLALKSSQDPEHYIDLEKVPSMDGLPEVRSEYYHDLYERYAQQKYSTVDYLPENVGFQPYAVIEMFERLKIAFHEFRQAERSHHSTAFIEHKIVFYAGILGHYVADGSQPLHTSVHYNGWFGPNPKEYSTSPGIHMLFETSYISRNVTPGDFSALVHPPNHLVDVFRSYTQFLRSSNTLVERLYQLEKLGAFRGSGSKEGLSFACERLGSGAQMLVNLWYTAWIDSSY